MSIPVPPGICVEWDQRDPSRAGSCLLCSWPGVLHSSEAGGEELKCDVPVLSRRLAYNFPVQGWIGGHVCHFSSIHTYHEQFPVYTVTTYCSCSFTQTTTNCNVFLFYCLFHKHLIFGLYCVHAPSPPPAGQLSKLEKMYHSLKDCKCTYLSTPSAPGELPVVPAASLRWRPSVYLSRIGSHLS